jgi:replicative DNA helicase
MQFTPDVTLLSAILMLDFETGVDEAAAIVTAEDFLLEEHRKLWQAMVAVREKGLPLSFTFVYEELKRVGVKDASLLIAQLSEEVPLKGYVPVYAKRVKEASRARRIAKAIELANVRIAEGESEKWVKDELMAEINEIEASDRDAEDKTHADVGPKVREALRDRLAGDESKRGLSTSLAALDHSTTGINSEELWIVGGMPGRGKSAFALQVAHHLTGVGVPVYLISLEMSAAQVHRRALRMKFGDTADWPGKRKAEVDEYSRDLETLPLYM